MSASAHFFSNSPHDQRLLGELLHALSQPLTSLHCSLELSIYDLGEQQQQTVSAALQQTETAIGLIQLMREYLDAEQVSGDHAVALTPVLRSVVENLSSIAAVRNVKLRVAGTCTASIRVAEPQLRQALQYLILAMIELQPAGGAITLLLGEGSEGAVLRAQGERCLSLPETDRAGDGSGNQRPKRDSVRATMRRVRLAIAARVLAGTGTALAFDDGAPGFVLRIPHSTGTAARSPFSS